MLWSSALLLAIAHFCAAKPLPKRWDDLVEKHAWAEVPHGWEYHSPAPADYTFEMHVALKQNKIDDLISSLMETSDPKHEKYLQFLHPRMLDKVLMQISKVWEALIQGGS